MVQALIKTLTEVSEKLGKMQDEAPRTEFERAKNNVDRAIEYLEETKKPKLEPKQD